MGKALASLIIVSLASQHEGLGKVRRCSSTAKSFVCFFLPRSLALSLSLSVFCCPSVRPPIGPFVRPSVCAFVCVRVSVSVSLSVRLPIRLSVCLSLALRFLHFSLLHLLYKPRRTDLHGRKHVHNTLQINSSLDYIRYAFEPSFDQHL